MASRYRRGKSKRGTRKRSVKQVAKQVRQLKKVVNASDATHTYKKSSIGNVTCGVGLCNHSNLSVVNMNDIETSIANFRYYDPSVPGTLTTASGATGTYSRNLHCKSIHANLEIMNNYQIPCKVKVYLCQPKADTSVAPQTYYTNGITDQVITGGDETTPQLYLSDIKSLNRQWKITCLKDVLLDAGKSFKVSHSAGSFDYDPSIYDSHSLIYQTKFKNFTFMIRLDGILSHDTVAAQRTTNQCAVDYKYEVKYVWKYDAGCNLDDIYVSDGRATAWTNAGVYTSKAPADNIGYSVS